MTNSRNNSGFTFWERFWLTIAVIGIIWFAYKFKSKNFDLPPETLFLFNIGIPFVWLTFQYRALRKTKIFVSWTIISLILLGFYFWLKSKSDSRFIFPNGVNAANGLKTPIIFLATFLGLRQISKKYFHTELISLPPLWSIYDEKEGRNINIMDGIAIIVFFIVIYFTGVY